MYYTYYTLILPASLLLYVYNETSIIRLETTEFSELPILIWLVGTYLYDKMYFVVRNQIIITTGSSI